MAHAHAQVNSVFQKAVPASTFASNSFANEFFRAKRCFRIDGEGCAQPGDEYYEVGCSGHAVSCRCFHRLDRGGRLKYHRRLARDRG